MAQKTETKIYEEKGTKNTFITPESASDAKIYEEKKIKNTFITSESAFDTKPDDTVSIEEEYVYESIELRNERVPNVFLPISYFLDEKVIADQKKRCFDTDVLREHFYNQRKFNEEQANKLISEFVQVVKKEENLIYVDTPCTIFGDIHGQYYDLLKILKHVNFEEETVIFVGDYVDRGCFSSEVFMLLMSLKL